MSRDLAEVICPDGNEETELQTPLSCHFSRQPKVANILMMSIVSGKDLYKIK